MRAKPYLSVGGVDVWLEHLVTGNVDYQNYWQLLSSNERQIAQRFVRDMHRHRYVVCHGKLRLLLSGYLNSAPECIRFARQAFGKPYLVDADGKPEPLQFNLSHSSEWMLLAVGRQSMGIDIEVWEDRHDLSSLVDECLAPSEKAYWKMLSVDQHVCEFYRFWTRKESLVKAVGSGVGIGLVGVVTSTGENPCFVSLPAAYEAPDWMLFDLELDGDVSGALTVRR